MLDKRLKPHLKNLWHSLHYCDKELRELEKDPKAVQRADIDQLLSAFVSGLVLKKTDLKFKDEWGAQWVEEINQIVGWDEAITLSNVCRRAMKSEDYELFNEFSKLPDPSDKDIVGILNDKRRQIESCKLKEQAYWDDLLSRTKGKRG